MAFTLKRKRLSFYDLKRRVEYADIKISKLNICANKIT